jgi:hypothetical protein
MKANINFCAYLKIKLLSTYLGKKNILTKSVDKSKPHILHLLHYNTHMVFKVSEQNGHYAYISELYLAITVAF